METKNPTAFFQIERIGNVTFYLYLRKGINVIKQTFTLDELPFIADGIKRTLNLDPEPIIKHIKRIFGDDLIDEYFKIPFKPWTYCGSNKVPTYLRN